MDARFLLDTNICIHIRRQRPPEVLARFQRLKPGEAVLSVITYGELIYGAEKSKFREQAIRQLTELAGLVPVMAVRPEGANHQWRRNPPGYLSIGPVADERLSRVTGGPEPRDKGHLGWLSDPAGRNACEA